MNPTRLLDLWKSRSDLRTTINKRKNEILALPTDQHMSALQDWKGELEPQIEQQHSKAAARQWTRRGQTSINLRAAFTLLMLMLAIYQALATPLLPFPGWGIASTLYATTLPAVGLAYGMVNLLLSQLIIANIAPKEMTQRYIQRLRDNTGGRGHRYIARWTWSVWWGGTPWFAIIATAVDLALGFAVAQLIFNLGYHYQHVDVLVTAAVLTLSQMWFGGLAWIAQMLSMYGLLSPQEKAVKWIEAQIKQIREPGENVSTMWYRFILALRTAILLIGLLTYVGITAMFYFGFLAKPHLTGSEADEIKWLLLVGGVASGMFFAGVVSMFINTGHSRKEKIAGAKSDIKNVLLSLPVNASGTFGNYVVGWWGHSYSTADANVLSVVWQQVWRVTIGQFTTVYNSVKKRREASQASEEQAADFLTLPAEPMPGPVPINPLAPQIELPVTSPTPQIEQATVSPSDEVAALVGNLLARVQTAGQQWTDEMGQASQIKDALAWSILELHARLTGLSPDDLYRDPEQITRMQAEATQHHERLTSSIQEHLGKARAAEQSLLAAKQALGGSSSGEEHTSE